MRFVSLLVLLAACVAAADEVPESHLTPGLHWEEGFAFKTADEAFELRLLGIVQADFRGYFNAHDTTDYDRFLVRRARLYVEGTVMKAVDYRWMVDFGNGEPSILDAFANARIFGPALQLRAGKFKQPFSMEQFVMEDLTLVVFERSLIDTLAPARNVGLMIHGRDVGGVLDYQLSVANGLRDSDFEEKRNEKDLLGRVAVRPFARWEGAPAPLARLQLGASASWGREADDVDPASFSTPLRVRWFRFTEGTRAVGDRFRLSPELQAFWGPVGVSAQLVGQWQQLASPSGVTGEARVQGFYGLATWVLTGEHRTSYAEFIHPAKPFDFLHPLAGSGALELVLRASGLRVLGAAAGGDFVDAAKVSTGAFEVSVGLNWYLSRFAWVMVDYEHAVFSSPVALGGPTGAVASNAAAIRTTVMW
ncbi:MAG: OprO/OprP family phosphate-selective porin [Myxococcota bacterium]